MPRVLERHPLLGGEVEVVLYATKPYYCARLYLSGERRYATKSCRTNDLEEAKEFAVKTWRVWRNTAEAGGSPLGTSLEQVVGEYLKLQDQRCADSEVSANTLRCTRTLFSTVFLLYCKHKGFRFVRDFPADGLNDYRQWRLNVSPKLVKRSQKTTGVKDSTLNRELTAFRTFFTKYLKQRGLTGVEPRVKLRDTYDDTFEANPPFSSKEWEKTWRHLRTWSEEPLKRASHRYWRQCFRRYLQTARWVGNRPSELVARLRWSEVQFQEGRTVSKKTGEKELLALVTVRKAPGTKNKRDRTVPSLAGRYLKAWLEFVQAYRKENGFRPLEPTDLVFGNPATSKPYPYTQWSKTWDVLRAELGLTHLNLYSTRSTFVTDLLEKGVDVYLVARLANHTLEVLQKHYDRQDLVRRASEATPRTYGAREVEKRPVNALELAWGVEAGEPSEPLVPY